MKLIYRKQYIERLLAVKNIPDIKVITGIRRSGKSKLMDSYIDIISKDDSVNIVRIKLNLKKFERLLNSNNLYDYIEQQYVPEKNNYLFIDEVQLCEGFERVINSIYEEELYDIYLTGSNAFLLSSDLATLFGGRVYELSLYPFSFNEYLDYYPSSDIDSAFDDYVKRGGMSGSYLYRSEEDAKKYVNGIYRSTITKDIISKFKVENEDLLVMIGNFLMDNLGSQTSIRNIDRFPDNFRFQLTKEEYDDLRSQIVTSNGSGGRRYRPYMFTEQGIAMLSGILRSDIAIQVSIRIMNSFVEMRRFIANNALLFEKVSNIELKQLEYQKSTDEKFDKVFQYIENHAESEQKIFFDGQIYDAFSLIVSIIQMIL